MAGPRTSTPKRSVAVARVDAPDPFSKRVVEQNSDDDYVPGGRKASKPKAPRKPSAPRRKLLDLPLDLQSEVGRVQLSARALIACRSSSSWTRRTWSGCRGRASGCACVRPCRATG